MTEKLHDQISAFFDGELPDAEQELLILRLARDMECRAALRRYALIGSVMRSASASLAVADLSQGVAAAIESEPTHDGADTTDDKLFKVLKPVAGFAVAASVTLVAITSLQQPKDPINDTAPVVQNPSNSLTPVPMPASFTETDRLTNYLIQHSEYSAPMGSRNVLVEIIGSDEAAEDDTEQATDGDEKTEE